MTYNNWLAKAHRSRKSAQLLNDAGDLVGAVNRAYYGMFYAAHAALAYLGVKAPSAKHGTLVSRFGQHLVRTGRVPDHFGRWLNQALELRSVGDYADDPPDPSEATRARVAASCLGRCTIEQVLSLRMPKSLSRC